MRTWLGLSIAFGLLPVWAAWCHAQDHATINALIDKAVKAMGGEEKVARLRTCSWKGKAEQKVNGKTFQLVHEGSAQGWDKYRVDVSIQAGGQARKVLTVLNGATGWAKENDSKAQDFPRELLAFGKYSLHAVRVCQWLPGLKDKAFQISPVGELKIGDTLAVGIRIHSRDRQDVNLFFSKANGLPVKSEVRLAIPGGQETTVEYYFSDYKEFDGIKHFGKITIKADGKEFITELTEISAQQLLDDNLFRKPKAEPPE
jgi:hypothetical protein